MAELFKAESFDRSENPSLVAELKKLQRDYLVAQSKAENAQAYAERTRRTNVLAHNLKAKGYNPEDFLSLAPIDRQFGQRGYAACFPRYSGP